MKWWLYFEIQLERRENLVICVAIFAKIKFIIFLATVFFVSLFQIEIPKTKKYDVNIEMSKNTVLQCLRLRNKRPF